MCQDCYKRKTEEDEKETTATDFDHDCEAYQICNTCLENDD